MNRFEEAIACYDKMAENTTDAYLAFYSKGMAYYYQQKYVEALDLFDKSISANKRFTNAMAAKAVTLTAIGIVLYLLKLFTIFLGNFKEALTWIDRGIAIQPVALLYLTKGDIVRGQGKLGEAEQLYDMAINCDPNDSELIQAFTSKGAAQV
jgi:tetratricopeptide (TPR) repeat protein